MHIIWIAFAVFTGLCIILIAGGVSYWLIPNRWKPHPGWSAFLGLLFYLFAGVFVIAIGAVAQSSIETASLPIAFAVWPLVGLGLLVSDGLPLLGRLALLFIPLAALVFGATVGSFIGRREAQAGDRV